MEETIPLYGDAVTVTCETLRKRALGVGVKPERIFFLPNGTDMKLKHRINILEARKSAGLPENAIIYTCGKSSFNWINPRNDPLWDLLIAHNNVVKVFPNAFLCFLGKGSEKCVAIAKKLGIDKNVIYADWQSSEKYPVYLASSDFMIMPLSNRGMFDRSRIPLRLLDYMAMGLPIIATDLPEIKTLLEDYGLLFKPNDPADLTNKIINAITCLESLKNKATKARENVIKKYSWRKLAKELETMYVYLLNNACNIGN